MNGVAFLLQNFGEFLKRNWARVEEFLQVLALVRFSLVLALVGGLIFFINDQAREVLRTMAEENILGNNAATLWFAAASFLCALSVWYSARVMFYLSFPGKPASATEFLRAFKANLPRSLGAGLLLLVAFGFAWAAGEEGATLAGHLLVLAVMAAALWGLAILVAETPRRKIRIAAATVVALLAFAVFWFTTVGTTREFCTPSPCCDADGWSGHRGLGARARD